MGVCRNPRVKKGQWKAWQTGKFIPLLARKAGYSLKIVKQEIK